MRVIIGSPPPALTVVSRRGCQPYWTEELLAESMLATPIHSSNRRRVLESQGEGDQHIGKDAGTHQAHLPSVQVKIAALRDTPKMEALLCAITFLTASSQSV